MKLRIAHVTTTHARDEVRVVLRECVSLVKDGYDVHLLVADGLGRDSERNITIHDAGQFIGRFKRVFVLPLKMLLKTREIKADFYHLHEPELLLTALMLRFLGKKIVYDSHEDWPRAILSRDWIPRCFRSWVSTIFELFENIVVANIAGIIAATPHITKRFCKINRNTINLNNFPLLNEVVISCKPSFDSKTVCYQGAITRKRGAVEMLQAIQDTDAHLLLAGPIEVSLERRLAGLPGWSKVDFLGIVGRQKVHEIMQCSCIGLLIFHPEGNHINAQPNKMFEYMSASLPIVASNFPLWREIIEGNKCGICVDPLDPKSISAAINYLLANPEIAKEMGENGRKAVVEKFNWQAEEKKLLEFYERL